MEIKDIRALTPEELNAKIYDLKQHLFELRRKKEVGS